MKPDRNSGIKSNITTLGQPEPEPEHIIIPQGDRVIRKSTDEDFEEIFNIINDAATAYKGIIPADRWHDPYRSKEELRAQIKEGVRFSCYVEGDEILGVMGFQDKIDVQLIRHAYVRTAHRNKGIGTALLEELVATSTNPVLIGTWKAAEWAIAFYKKHGFRLVDEEERNRLLKKYWVIPDRQVETSVVLVDQRYRQRPRGDFASTE